MIKLHLFIFAALWFGCASFAEEETVLRAYPVRFAKPVVAAEIIQSMVLSTNSLLIETTEDRLFVRGTKKQHAVVREVLRELDVRPRNVRIDVQFDRRSESSAREAGIRPVGPVVIGRDGIRGSLEGRLQDRSSTVTEHTAQILVAMEGRSASLRVGETVPHLAWLTEYGYRHGYIRTAHIEWRDVGSFLAMEPEILGDGWIRVRLTPTLSGYGNDGLLKTIHFTELATEVVARDGEPVSIGGLTGDRDFYSKFLVGRSGGREVSITDITLTPRILE